MQGCSGPMRERFQLERKAEFDGLVLCGRTPVRCALVQYHRCVSVNLRYFASDSIRRMESGASGGGRAMLRSTNDATVLHRDKGRPESCFNMRRKGGGCWGLHPELEEGAQ